MFFKLFGSKKKLADELHAAVQKEDIAGIRAVLDKGADIDALAAERQETALHVAAAMGNKALVQVLLSRGANPNIVSGQNLTPLLIAAAQGDTALPIVELLLTGRADPTFALKTGPKAGVDVLFVAATQGSNAMLRHLLDFGVKPGVLPNGSTLMHMAGVGGNAGTVDIACEAGASVHDLDQDGATPLHHAVAHANDLAVAALLDRGADIEKRTRREYTPLHHAAAGNRLATLKLLLERGAKPDVIAVDGDLVTTPLLGAAVQGHDDVVRLLLDAGVSPEQEVADLPPWIEMVAAAGKHSTFKLLKDAIHARHEQNVAETLPNLMELGKGIGAGAAPEAIRGMSLVEFGEAFYRNVRYCNVMAACSAQGTLPFETIGDYLDAGETGRMAMLRLPNLGRTSITGLEDAILAAIQRQPLVAAPAAVPEAVPVEPSPKQEDLAGQIESNYPGVFAPLLKDYAALPESEGFARSRLRTEMLLILNDVRLADVATRRFRGETLAEIGETMGLSRERVRQIEARIKPWINMATHEPESPPEPAEEATTVDGVRHAWRGMYQRLKEYHDRHGDADVPLQWTEYPKLGNWVSHQRQKFKKGDLLPEHIRMLEELGFSWSLRERGTWDDRFGELVAFKQRHGHFDVPADYAVAPKLRQFIASSRHLYKVGALDSERVGRLEGIDFTFDTGPRRRRNDSEEHVIATNELPHGFTLNGCTVAITGRLERYTRDEATRLARQHGANVLDKFSSKVELLVVGADAASKLDAALQRGIPVIDEAHFSALLAAESNSSRPAS